VSQIANVNDFGGGNGLFSERAKDVKKLDGSLHSQMVRRSLIEILTLLHCELRLKFKQRKVGCTLKLGALNQFAMMPDKIGTFEKSSFGSGVYVWSCHMASVLSELLY
jgi:hypothetical protein